MTFKQIESYMTFTSLWVSVSPSTKIKKDNYQMGSMWTLEWMHLNSTISENKHYLTDILLLYMYILLRYKHSIVFKQYNRRMAVRMFYLKLLFILILINYINQLTYMQTPSRFKWAKYKQILLVWLGSNVLGSIVFQHIFYNLVRCRDWCLIISQQIFN